MSRFKTVFCGLVLASGLAAAQQTIPITAIVELSGNGATSGTMFKNGLELAIKEVNAAGGVLGRKIVLQVHDTQSNPGVAKSLAAKAADEEPYVVMGPGFSGSMLVSMSETRRAQIPNFTAAEATSITEQGNPYVFRTAFSQATGMPKVARYIAETMKAKSVALIYVNSEFGKGGREALTKELLARNVQLVADISTDPGQVDFSAAVLRAKQANPDVIFPYTTEEESARLLRELRKQGVNKPIVGETTIVEQKVIDLAGDAANGVVGHVGLTAAAPIPAVRAFAERFEKEYGAKPNHNAMKGYIGLYTVKAVTEKIGKVDRKAFAQAMKNVKLSTTDVPGLLMDVSYDSKGDIDRESFLVEVKDGKQVITAKLPPMRR